MKIKPSNIYINENKIQTKTANNGVVNVEKSQ